MFFNFYYLNKIFIYFQIIIQISKLLIIVEIINSPFPKKKRYFHHNTKYLILVLTFPVQKCNVLNLCLIKLDLLKD